MRKMNEIKVFTNLNIINPELFYEKIDYTFDYNEESIYNRSYSRLINNVNKLKNDYRYYFEIKKISNKSIYFSFEFGRFCNEFGISYEYYKDLIEKKENELPFPIIGKIIAKKKDKTFECCFRSESFNHTGFYLNYPANDVYLIAYHSNTFCEFNLLEDLTKEEKMEYENYLLFWK